jgi:hypothetical protein
MGGAVGCEIANCFLKLFIVVLESPIATVKLPTGAKKKSIVDVKIHY